MGTSGSSEMVFRMLRASSIALVWTLSRSEKRSTPSGQRLQCMRIWQRSRERISSATPSRRCIRSGTWTTLEQLPEKLVHRGVEALFLGTIYFFAELVPMNLGIPYAHIWNVLRFQSTSTSRALPELSTHGVGESVPVASMNNEDLSGAIDQVFGNPSYGDAARRFKKRWPRARGWTERPRAFQVVNESEEGGLGEAAGH